MNSYPEVVLERRNNNVKVAFNVRNQGYTPPYEWVEFKLFSGAGLERLEHPGGETKLKLEGDVAVARLKLNELVELKR